MKVTVSTPGMNTDSDTAADGAAAQGTEAQEYDLPEGTTVEDVISRLGLPEFTPEMALVNGEQVELGTELHDGDAVALNGPMGGM